MTEDELVEKVAEAMWKARHPSVSFSTTALSIYEKLARAAIACVRENDKMVHADSTGAVRSTDLSAVNGHAADCAVHNEPAMPNGPCDCDHERHKLWRHLKNCIDKRDAVPDHVSSDMIKRALDAIDFAYDFVLPIDDRTSPPSSREPNLPPSLLLKMVPKGGIQC